MNNPKCHNLNIDPQLKCTPEMVDLCEQEDGVRCDGHGSSPEPVLAGQTQEVGQ